MNYSFVFFLYNGLITTTVDAAKIQGDLVITLGR